MKSRPFSTIVLALPFLAFACSSANHRPTVDDGTGAASSNGGGSSGTDKAFGDAGLSGTGVDTTSYVAPTDLGCPSRAQEILALDFRSGWWSGGGGGMYSGTVLPQVVGACPQTSIDYHHFEKAPASDPTAKNLHAKCVYKNETGGSCQDLSTAAPHTVATIRASFEKKAVGDYTQIWVLSGSDQDPSDIPVGDALFQGIVADTKGACIPMLVVAGDGFMTHANTVSNDLGMGNVFTQQTNPPSFFDVALAPAETSSTISGPSLRPHVLLKGVDALVDNVSAKSLIPSVPSFKGAHGDSIAASVPAPHYYDVIATDTAGRPSIAVGAAKVAGDAYRPFIFDGGWQRMYVLGHAGTAQYLKNIVMYLGLVGCKAAPIGPIK